MQIHFKELSNLESQQWLQSAIVPRPIALASTVDQNGNSNLAPFSFFNLFSANPPIIIFSPVRRAKDGSLKHTIENLLEVPECVIGLVDASIVHQVSMASREFLKTEDEFDLAGFHKVPASLVRPPLIKECKINMECRVKEVKSLGDEGGAGQLVIAEVICMHIDEELIGADGRIDQTKLNFVARMGGDWYCKTDADNMFQIDKPV